MRTLIKNGTIVTAVDTYEADVWIEDEQDRRASRRGRASCRPGRQATIDARGQVRHARRHRRAHAPRHAVRRHDVERRLRDRHARGGARRHDDASSTSPSRRRASRSARASTRGTRRPRARPPSTTRFHMIMTDVNDGTVAEMGSVVDEGITSFKMFMAYPGVLFVDDGQIFRAHAARGGDRRAHLHARRERHPASTSSSQQALAKGHTAPDLPRAHAPADRRGRGHAPRDLPRRDGRRARLHRAPLAPSARSKQVVEARDRGLPAFAETCPQYLFLLAGRPRRAPGFEGAKFVCTPPLPPARRCRRTSGAASARTICRSSPPTTARSA